MSDPNVIPELTCDEVRELAGAFVLGALDAAEAAAVRAHLAAAGHADAHPEIAELGAVVPALAEIVPIVEPPAGLKDRILAAAAADLEAGTGSPSLAAAATSAAAAAVPAPVAGAPIPAPPAPPVAFPTAEERAARRTPVRTGTWLLRIAAVLVIVALGGWNLSLQNDLSAARSYEQSVAVVLDTAAQPGSLTAVLAGEPGTGAGLAAVDSAGNVALAIRNLAPTAGTSVYEAWVIASDGV
ncbi:MAG TPA: zf-HC2 domain-containing protein, partial [Frankiaceae bacterium]|nr:zf-HC2 domain-containing protein [Frankiaceae bacterium]